MAVQETTIHVDTSEPAGSSSRRGGCFCFGSAWWERISAVHQGDHHRRWWTRGVRAFRKVREWSEIVAGPKWKTFIRRLNRNTHHRTGSGSAGSGNGKFQYDPLSYSLNFDEGHGYNGNFDEEEEVDDVAFRDFSSRYVLGQSEKRVGGDVAVLAN